MREDNVVTEDLSFKQDELPADRSLVIERGILREGAPRTSNGQQVQPYRELRL